MRTGIITQARTGSTRLPRKVLKSINGTSLLEYHIERLEESEFPVVVATSQKNQDDEIVELCGEIGVPYYRGSEEDVLSRYVETARHYEINPIIRVTSDCPLIDAGLITQGIQLFKNGAVDYLSNNYPSRTYPHGLDFQILSLDALKEAHRNASASDYREHVPRYIRVSDAFSKKGLNLEHDYSWIRITVDYEDDFELMKVLIDDFSAHTKDWKQIVQIFEDNPELLKINESRNDNLGE